MIAWEQTRNNTVAMKNSKENCNVKIEHAYYQIVKQDVGVRVELVVGYRTLAKTPIKLQEFANYLIIKKAMAANLESLKQELENTQITTDTNTVYA